MWSTINSAGNVEYRESYKDPLTGKRKTVCVTFTKDTAANRKLATKELHRLIDEQLKLYDTEPLTLKELYDKYIAYQKQTVKASTWRRNERTLHKIIPIIGSDILCNNLKAGYVKDRLLTITNSPTTLNEYLKRFKSMIRWGYESDYLDNLKLTTKLTSFPDKTRREKIADKYLEPRDVKKLLTHMQDSQELWCLLTKFLILSGLRIGELIALEDKDVTDVIKISKTYDINNELITTPKTPESNREVFIQPELAQCIKQIRRYMRSFALLNGVRSPLFVFSKHGEYISYYSYEKYLKESAETVLGRRITPHTLRHTHASILFAENVPLETISRRLGHENSRVTREIYLHIIEKVRENDNNIMKTKRML